VPLSTGLLAALSLLNNVAKMVHAINELKEKIKMMGVTQWSNILHRVFRPVIGPSQSVYDSVGNGMFGFDQAPVESYQLIPVVKNTPAFQARQPKPYLPTGGLGDI
jgi:hypothetical protein